MTFNIVLSILGKTTRALSNYILVNTLEMFMCSSGVKKGTDLVVSNLKLFLVGSHCSSKYLMRNAMQVWIDMGRVNDERNPFNKYIYI